MTKATEPKVQKLTPKPAEGLDLLRVPFAPNQISKLPKPTQQQTEEVKQNFKKGFRCPQCGGWHHPEVIHLDYVGHAALTDRLLDADREWTWNPVANPEDLGLPTVEGGMWITLTVCGVSRYGFGHAGNKTGGDAVKEIIGDALRNAAMRFGAALDLWHKGDLHADNGRSPTAVQAALGEEATQFTEEEIKQLNTIANSLVDYCTLSSEGEDVDYKVWELMEPLDDADRLYLWNLLQSQSAVRKRVKAIVVAHEQQKQQARGDEPDHPARGPL